MVFSSIIFLFFFLPITLLVYYIMPRRASNLILLGCSLAFYTWGELEYTVIMLLAIVSNYLLVRVMAQSQYRKTLFVLTLILNLALLGFFKYANFFIENLNLLLMNWQINPLENTPIHLPIGISFFTFQAMSYVIDVYRGTNKVQKNLLDLGLYIALFPQLIAGPIVRYKDIADQLIKRTLSREKFAEGIQRFVIGLGKKILIANNMALIADTMFAFSHDQLSTSMAWIGIIAYSLQIYFDFSGYSDMAIGLGLMFGFDFIENFNYPYIAQSIQDFWRRWHISLSNWFRDYLYIPLGGNRKGVFRTYINLYIVFFLTGLWHGASWNFIFWGLWHGTFLVLERLGLKALLERLWQPFRHVYTILVFTFGWVFFRAINFSEALNYINRMLIWYEGNPYRTLALIINNKLWLVLAMGIILSVPLHQSKMLKKVLSQPIMIRIWIPLFSTLSTIIILYLSLMSIASSAYNPFIYFRF